MRDQSFELIAMERLLLTILMFNHKFNISLHCYLIEYKTYRIYKRQLRRPCH